LGVYDLWLIVETFRTCFVSPLAIVVVLRFGTAIICFLLVNLVI
jgi:hypothetical protein